MSTPGRRSRQRGGALLIIAALLLLGIAWGAMSAMRNITPPGQAEREAKTGAALQAAKKALLGYMVQLAAQSTTTVPGMLPCPEALAWIGTANEGDEDTSCSSTVGRLPWLKLGIDQLRDGDGEPLWYALSPGFRSAPLNFDSAGALSYTTGGSASTVVAVILAPGAPLNTMSLGGTPPGGCSGVAQQVGTRNTAPLNAANFFECGNASGTYTHLGLSDWTNDRVIAITTAEWIAAITPVIGDRMQRELAPAIRDWDAYELAQTGKNWGMYGQAYLPFASDWGDPTTTNYCGDQDTTRGLMPIDSTCYDEKWELISATTGGLLSLFGSPNCTDQGTYMRCRFQRILGLGSATARVILRAADAGRAFRGSLQASDITMTNSGTEVISAMVIDNASSDAYIVIDFTWPANLLLLAVGQVVTANIPHLQPAAIHTDPRITWFVNNGWHRYAWYAVSPGATAQYNNAGAACAVAGDPGCLYANGFAASNGNANDKRLVLVLSGPPLGTQSIPSADLTQYFEAQNASIGVVYETQTTGTTFNDRLAACPFKHVNHSGADVTLCN